MTSGTGLMNSCLLALSRAGSLVWRNNTGSGWAGKSFELSAGQTYRAKGGERVVMAARPLRAGLCTGSSDIIGGTPVVVTPEMVGRTVLVFTAVEIKDGTGRATPEQKNFVDVVRKSGGFAAIARSVADAVAAIKSWGA
ncbi:VRR-NUC domain-containing protein [Aureimonas sp. AU40]|uniref:VRR-NUC domain-containing protein n=1 Tax=Aureimonas sp. AU40 TaxID=1637747 RepID=UPI0007833903|nr:VRR-NUC domain-containing protein [Aureimonas sp. AU40]